MEEAAKFCNKLIDALAKDGALLPGSDEKIRETFRLYSREAQERETLLIDLKNREIGALEEQLREAHRQTLFVNEVGQQITASLDLDSIIRTFHRSVRHQIPADRILLATRRGGENELFYRYYGDSTQEEKGVDSIFISAAHRLVARSLKDGRTLIENYLIPEEDCFLTRRGGSVLIFPLKTGSVALGALVLHTDQEGAYRDSHHQLLESLSLFLGVSLSNALSHQDVAALNKELQGERAELIASYSRITRMANYDSLTDLPNLRLLNEFLPRYMNQALRRGWILGVFFIDLDDFKPVNDLYGHEAGDALLREMGRRIQVSLRQSDIVARVGGDEFIALVQGLEGEGDAENITRKLLEGLREPFLLDGTEVTVGASVGISLYRGGDETPELLKRQADLAMYEVKRGTKHGFRIFRESDIPES